MANEIALVQSLLEAGATPEAVGLADALASGSNALQVLPTKVIGALQLNYSKATHLGGVARRVINQNFGDVAQATLSPVTEHIGIFGRATSTDVRLDKADPMLRPSHHARAAKAIAIAATDAILNGDRSTDSTNIDGLKVRCTGDQAIKAATDGATLAITMVEDLMDAVDPSFKRVIFSNNTLIRQIKRLIVGHGVSSLSDVASGVFSYEGVEFIPIGDDLDGDPILGFDETCGTSEVTASMYCVGLDPNVELSGVKLLVASNSIEIIENGTSGSMIQDVVEFAFGLAVFDTRAAARLYGVKAS